MKKFDYDKIDAVIFTEHYRLEGTVHIRSGDRFSDFLNVSKNFIPVTDATLYTIPQNTLLYKVGFLGLNREDITIIFPANEGRKESE
ncbi:MAG: hypothetical protein QME81_07185 [bacterium]|nr:hypothetical protein [bacterium]